MKTTKQSAGSRYPKLYGRRWRKIRAYLLANSPFCVMCEEEGKVTPATEVDHIKKHDGNPEMFYDLNNLQPLCAFHHRSVKAKMERGGKVIGSKLDGSPLDPNHHWNQ